LGAVVRRNPEISGQFKQWEEEDSALKRRLRSENGTPSKMLIMLVTVPWGWICVSHPHPM